MTDWLGGDQHGLRVIEKHVDTEWWHWMELTDQVVYRDAIGRRNNGDGWMWLVLRCVQPACPGEAIVRRWAIEATVNEAMRSAV